MRKRDIYERTNKREKKNQTKWQPTPDTGIGKTAATLYSLSVSQWEEFLLSDTTKSTKTRYFYALAITQHHSSSTFR